MKRVPSSVNALGCNITYSVLVLMDNEFDAAKLQAEVRSRTRRAVEIERDTMHPYTGGYTYQMTAARQEDIDVFCGALIAIDEDLNRIQETNRLYALLSK